MEEDSTSEKSPVSTCTLYTQYIVCSSTLQLSKCVVLYRMSFCGWQQRMETSME